MSGKPTNSTSNNHRSSRFSVSSLLSGSSNSNNNSKKMPAKAPIYLKAGYKDGKKLREILSTEMISRPLGDVRHTTHVGRGADDVFGDVTFLTEKEIDLASAAAAVTTNTSSSTTSSGGETSSNKMGQQGGVMMMTSQSCGDVTQGDIATLRRNNGEKFSGGGKKKKKNLKHLSQNEVEISTSCEQLTSPAANNTQLANDEVMTSQTSHHHQTDNISIFEGWGLDLGPTIMDDVMRVMDKVEQL